jgi:hypothetical protein
MITPPKPRANGAGQRKDLPEAVKAALWAVSNGHCYKPGCVTPIVCEVRPGVYEKNAHIAHIYGVRPRSERHQPDMPAEERDSFAHLLLLCTAHHAEIDGKGGADLYPPETLLKWKAQHEGADGSVLNTLIVPNHEALMRKLIEIAERPLERLEAVTQRLEETGTVTADTVAELKRIIAAMSTPSSDANSRTAAALSYAAEVLGTSSFSKTAGRLAQAAEILPAAASQLESAVQKASQFY